MRKKMQQFQVDLMMLGQISKTGNEYSLSYRICNLDGDVQTRDTMSSSSWEAIKEKFKLSLIQQGLAPIHYAVKPIPVTFEVVDQNGKIHAIPIELEGKKKYKVDGKGDIVPGRYQIKLPNQNYQPQTTWIEIKRERKNKKPFV